MLRVKRMLAVWAVYALAKLKSREGERENMRSYLCELDRTYLVYGCSYSIVAPIAGVVPVVPCLWLEKP